MAVIITIIDAKELNLLINTSNKMINIEYKGYTMQALPSYKWCKVQAPLFINEFGQNVNNTGALVRQRLSPRECTFLLVSLVQLEIDQSNTIKHQLFWTSKCLS